MDLFYNVAVSLIPLQFANKLDFQKCPNFQQSANVDNSFMDKVCTVVPVFKALGPSTAQRALNPGSALFPRLDLEHFDL